MLNSSWKNIGIVRISQIDNQITNHWIINHKFRLNQNVIDLLQKRFTWSNVSSEMLWHFFVCECCGVHLVCPRNSINRLEVPLWVLSLSPSHSYKMPVCDIQMIFTLTLANGRHNSNKLCLLCQNPMCWPHTNEKWLSRWQKSAGHHISMKHLNSNRTLISNKQHAEPKAQTQMLKAHHVGNTNI